MHIPLSRPDITEEDIQSVVDVLRTPFLSLGPKLPQFEQAMASHVGSRYAVAVNSGTSALHLAVRALGIGEGDEVITTPFSFVASANCILFERALPRFVDILPTTLCLDPALVERAITPRTKAILGVDVFGHPADWDALRLIARAKGLALIEDSCESLGARYRGRAAGTLADCGMFAFYPNKQMTTGEGGIIVTDDERLASLARSMRNQGRGESGSWLQHERLGYNYRLSDINCALGVSQLRRLDGMLRARATVAGWYSEALAPMTDLVSRPFVSSDVDISWFVYVVQLREQFTQRDRDAVLVHLRERGIGCSNYFSPIHLQPYFQSTFGYRPGMFPITESVSGRTLALPFYNQLTHEEIGIVCGELHSAIRDVTMRSA